MNACTDNRGASTAPHKKLCKIYCRTQEKLAESRARSELLPDIQNLNEVARCLFTLGNYPGAIEVTEKLCDLLRDMPLSKHLLDMIEAHQMMAMSLTAQARVGYSTTEGYLTSNERAISNSATTTQLLQFACVEFRMAVEFRKVAMEACPGDECMAEHYSADLFNLASCLERLGRTSEVVDVYRSATVLDTNVRVDAYANLSVALRQLWIDEKADAFDSTQAFESLCCSNNLKESIKAAFKALEIKPTDRGAGLQLAIGKRYLELQKQFRSMSAQQLYDSGCQLGLSRVASNREDAKMFFRASNCKSEGGFPAALHNLGVMYGEDGNHSKSVEFYESASEKGDKESTWNLAHAYSEGIGVQKNQYKAAELYKEAAEAGKFMGWYHRANYYAQGDGVPQNHEEATACYAKSAAAGHAASLCCLGVSYSNGDGVEVDCSRARELWEVAAAKGNKIAKRNLSQLPSRTEMDALKVQLEQLVMPSLSQKPSRIEMDILKERLLKDINIPTGCSASLNVALTAKKKQTKQQQTQAADPVKENVIRVLL